MKVKVKLNGGIMPEKKHKGDAAFDLYVPRDVKVMEGRQVIDMGFAVELPKEYGALVRPRSGCSLKGIEVFNDKGDSMYIDADVKIGLVDSNYRNNVGTILQVKTVLSLTNCEWYIKKGSRISQMRIVYVPDIELVEAESLSETERDGGFGSTGQM